MTIGKNLGNPNIHTHTDKHKWRCQSNVSCSFGMSVRVQLSSQYIGGTEQNYMFSKITDLHSQYSLRYSAPISENIFYVFPLCKWKQQLSEEMGWNGVEGGTDCTKNTTTKERWHRRKRNEFKIQRKKKEGGAGKEIRLQGGRGGEGPGLRKKRPSQQTLRSCISE